MKDNFTLPAKWYITGTDSKKNADQFNTYCKSIKSPNDTFAFLETHCYYPEGNIMRHTTGNPPTNHIKITFEQFLEHVIKTKPVYFIY